MSESTPNKELRVRFAPSPTGKLHIGGARTAIFNWAFARAQGGSFILRIEDTDPERSTEENTQIILRALRWLGLDWDEGPDADGPYGPYTQTKRMDSYREALDKLKTSGAAYPCFCTKERLDEKRRMAEEQGIPYTGYDRCCRNIAPAEANRRIAAGESHVWRLAVPENHGPIVFDDAVYGRTEFPAEVMDDMILMRSDGTPTYNFAVVCDDANMHISHVIRGDDHLSNTPRQILVYEALGAPVPTFAHLSMILGPDGKKLSKRHGATSVEEYQREGYLPDVMVNFLALLGWSLDGETTIIPRDVLAREFSLERITRKDAIFDEQKLKWMNAQYIKEMSPQSWAKASIEWLARSKARGAKLQETAIFGENPERTQLASDEIESARADIASRSAFYESLYPLIAEREQQLSECEEKLLYMFWGSNVALDEKSVGKVLLKEDKKPLEVLKETRAILADESIPWECEPLQARVRQLQEKLELKAKFIFQPIRVAVCGNMVSPPLFESIELLKREDVLARIDKTIALISAYGR